MDQKYTKRQNERPPKSPEIEHPSPKIVYFVLFQEFVFGWASESN